MPKPTPRQALTACAAHVRDVYGPDAADLIEAFRDRRYPDAPTRPTHRWARVHRSVAGAYVDRKCTKCGLVEDYAPIREGGRPVVRYVLPDGTARQKSTSRTPECVPSRPTEETR